MGYSIDLRVNQIRQIIESNDPNTLQYLLPAIKLVKSEYAENTQLEVSELIITLSLDVIKYLIQISGNSLYENRLVTECSIVISQFICCIYDRIPSQEEKRSEVISAMISLFDNQRSDMGLCVVLFSFVNRLSSEVLRLPKNLVEKLCKICSHILSNTENYTDLILSYTLSLISILIELSENLEWFVKNGLILQLSTLVNGSNCTVTMCRYFIVILNKLASVESHIDELSSCIGFTIIINCIQTFVEEATKIDFYYQIVELCFIYLLRVFVQDTKNRIAHYQSAVTELIRFLYDALFSPYYLTVTKTKQSDTAKQLISVHYQTDRIVLMEYVMSLFALLCYNSEYPEIIQPATISHICQRINTLDNMNVILFLHQFLYYMISVNPTLIGILLQDSNLGELVENLHSYPSESLLTIFAKVIHYEEDGEDHVNVVNILIENYFPSLLIELIILSNENSSFVPNQSYPITGEAARLGDVEGSVTSRQVSARVQLIALDLLHVFYNLGYSIILEDSRLILALLNIANTYSNKKDTVSNQIVVFAGILLICIGRHEANFAYFENEPTFIASICNLITKNQQVSDHMVIFFNLLEQYALYGSIQRLITDPKFVEVLRGTQRLLGDYGALMLQNGNTESDPSNLMPVTLSLAMCFCSVISFIGDRLSQLPPQDHPVLGEIFTFLEAVVSTVVKTEIVLAAVDACTRLLLANNPAVKERMGKTIRNTLANGVNKGVYEECCRNEIIQFLDRFS